MMDPSKLGEMMEKAQSMQAQMQEELRARTVEGSAGGGMVVARMNGLGELIGVKIDPTCVNADDVGMLEDLVRAAVNGANAEVEKIRLEQARGMAGQFGLPGGLL